MQSIESLERRVTELAAGMCRLSEVTITRTASFGTLSVPADALQPDQPSGLMAERIPYYYSLESGRFPKEK